jgi:hypothetical protein
MMDIKTVHREAMDYADRAFDARQKGDEPGALVYFSEGV